MLNPAATSVTDPDNPTSACCNADLIVVGAGMIGLATAYLAHKQGQKVIVIDRMDRPVESSIQNFGHACFTAQADRIQPVAEKARAGWLAAAADAGFWAATPGTIVPVVSAAEHAVIEEFAEHRGPDQVRLLSARQTAEALGLSAPESAGGAPIIGGAHLIRDARVNPREAAPALAEWLAHEGVTFWWNTQVTAVSGGQVATTTGTLTAGHVAVCPGWQLRQIFPELAERHAVRTCTLAMSLIRRPARVPQEFAMLTGTSLARYDGFCAMPSSAALREDLAERQPELVDCVANLMATGIPGGLLIGDSHAYALSAEPFIDEDVASLLLARATELLGIDQPRVIQRWQGRYADSEETNLVLERPDEKTTVAVVTSGIGMTLSFGIADLIIRGDSVPGF